MDKWVQFWLCKSCDAIGNNNFYNSDLGKRKSSNYIHSEYRIGCGAQIDCRQSQ